MRDSCKSLVSAFRYALDAAAAREVTVFPSQFKGRGVLELILLTFLEFCCNSYRWSRPALPGRARTYIHSRTGCKKRQQLHVSHSIILIRHSRYAHETASN